MNPNGPYQPQPQSPPVQPIDRSRPQGYEYNSLPPVDTARGAQPSAATPPPNPSNVPPYQQAPQVDYMGNLSDQQRQEYSIDYLNKIAPKEQKTINRFALFSVIGAVLFSILFAFILIGSSGSPSANAQLVPIAERVATLQAVTAEQQPQLTENQISEANAALSSFLTSMNTDVQSLMKARNLKDNNTSQLTTEKTYAATLSKTLDDAYQRGTLDRTYTAQMTYELTLFRGKLSRLKQSSTSSDIDTFCSNGMTNIDTILKTYSTFDATKS